MIAVCAWCEKEGRSADRALIGERQPLDDRRTTHGICDEHRATLEARIRRLKEDAERAREDAERAREDACRAVKEAEQRRDDAENLERLVDP